jgi:DNA-binding MarR family transcriptional regulator
MDLHSILASHHPKTKEEKKQSHHSPPQRHPPTMAEIPDLFFDEILVKFKLNRLEILALMYLYRYVWCRPNLYQTYGMGQVLALSQVAEQLHVSSDELITAIRKLESMGFIETIRSGQYFVRKYFTQEFDDHYGMTYDHF